jgi:hypothetical protein
MKIPKLSNLNKTYDDEISHPIFWKILKYIFCKNHLMENENYLVEM